MARILARQLIRYHLFKTMMRQLILYLCLIWSGAVFAAEPEPASVPERGQGFQNVQGSEKALHRLHLMFESMGGNEAWANAKSLYMIQRTRSPRIGDGILTMSWHDLEAPGEWGDVQHANLKVRYAWSEDGGWLRKGGEYRDYIADEIKERMFYWERDLYTLYRRLARDEAGYTVKAAEPFGFTVLNSEFEEIAEFQLTRDGELYRWQQLGGKKQHTLLFGPYKSYGETRFPDWMTSADGTWGAYQIQVMPSPIAFREQVSLKKPVREWHGGAVKSNCEEP